MARRPGFHGSNKNRSQRRRLLLDAGPGVPAYDFTMGVETYASAHHGYYGAGASGTIDPATFEGETILLCSSHSTVFQLNFTNAQIGASTEITLEFEGAPESSYTATWNGSTQYQFSGGTHPALHDYLASVVGTEIGVNMTAV